MTPIYLGVEDELSEAVGTAILHNVLGKQVSISTLGKRGFGYLYKNVSKFAQIANRDLVLMLTDLDKNDCAPALRSKWLKNLDVPQRMSFRIAVREIESWLLADRESIAGFLGVSAAKIPHSADQIDMPKEKLLSLAQGARREIRDDLLPRKGVRAIQGLGYNARLVQFVRDSWNIDRARVHSNSLERAIKAVAPLGKFVA